VRKFPDIDPVDFLVKIGTFDAILIFGCHFGFFFVSSDFLLIFFKNKTVGRLEKGFSVNLLQYFKNKSPEIPHLGTRHHFGLFQNKIIHDLFVKSRRDVT
jgi:hypothetical protein